MEFFSPTPSAFQEEMMHEDMLLWDLSMEHFDLAVLDPHLIFTPVEEPQVVSRGAFVKYERPTGQLSMECLSSRTSSDRNIHRRVISLLRRIPKAPTEYQRGEFSRGFRHMMRERQRRERLSQSYADLRSMLPYRSKADKKSIVQSATAYVEELKGVEEELLRRNDELKLKNGRRSNLGGETIRIRVANPTSTLDSMIGALQSLKAMDVKARAIRTDFFGHELAVIMSVETKRIRARDVERAVECALVERSR